MPGEVLQIAPLAVDQDFPVHDVMIERSNAAVNQAPRSDATREPNGDAVGRSGSTACWPSSWNLDFEVSPGSRAVYCSNDCGSNSLDTRPARCGKYYDGELSRCGILLIL